MFTSWDIATQETLSTDKRPRSKRIQVSRACDWCRLNRVKCDPVWPCRNCKLAQKVCVNGNRDDFKNVAAATR